MSQITVATLTRRITYAVAWWGGLTLLVGIFWAGMAERSLALCITETAPFTAMVCAVGLLVAVADD